MRLIPQIFQWACKLHLPLFILQNFLLVIVSFLLNFLINPCINILLANNIVTFIIQVFKIFEFYLIKFLCFSFTSNTFQWTIFLYLNLIAWNLYILCKNILIFFQFACYKLIEVFWKLCMKFLYLGALYNKGAPLSFILMKYFWKIIVLQNILILRVNLSWKLCVNQLN